MTKQGKFAKYAFIRRSPAVKQRDLRVFFLIFTASGFAGLIYESVWTHYLKLFLGHAAYAQALVLAVFMGGLALGSLLCSKYTERIANLLIGYAVVEVIIGLCAVFFHPLYVRFLDSAYSTIIPMLGSPLAVATFKWTSSSLLILPQSILLGMTFPLMTAGLIRRFPQAHGSIVAMLYFTNSIGAAVGVLASGFLFIGWVGLPGTLAIAGIINIVVATVVWLENKEHKASQPGVRRSIDTAPAKPVAPAMYPLFLMIALLTGLSSFIYEIGWIRMLSLVLGSSTHAFELMLSAFIMGIAFGGLWIKQRIDSLRDPRRFLAQVQIAMGILALATLPVYGSTFNIMAWLVNNLPRTETGYFLLNLSSHGLALVVMLPAAFCAGMTLPLITTALMRNGNGEKSIGAVYGLNTIGSILGVFIAVHLAMPLFGLKGMIMLGAGIDIALGLGLIWWMTPSRRSALAYAAVGIAPLMLTLFFVKLDPNKMASGVYRYGTFLDSQKQETLFHQDGKTATVSVTKDSTDMIIRTNGKPDAAIQVAGAGHTTDEETMELAGAMGAILRPEARTAAIIGWGSGLTTNTLLAASQIESLDTIEIEPEMIKAAALFGPRVRLAYDDPRSHRHIEDAKSYFSHYGTKYDLIISEPSNPWVSGVASLFTREFYSRIRQYVNDNGLFIQWIQLYEIDMPLVASIMNALSPYFSDYAIYSTNGKDILIIASPAGTIKEHNASFSSMGNLARELHKINVLETSDISIRLIGKKAVLAPLFESYPITTNSDYTPVVDLYAVRSRFFRAAAYLDFENLAVNQLPVLQMLGKQHADPNMAQLTFSNYPKTRMIYFSTALYQYLMQGKWNWAHQDSPMLPATVRSSEQARQVLTNTCTEESFKQSWWPVMLNPVARIVPFLSATQQASLLRAIETSPCSKRYSASNREFLLLLAAVGKQDPARMVQLSSKLLAELDPKTTDADLLDYALSAAILGNLSSGNVQQARQLWDKYGSLLPDKYAESITMRLLLAHLASPQEH